MNNLWDLIFESTKEDYGLKEEEKNEVVMEI